MSEPFPVPAVGEKFYRIFGTGTEPTPHHVRAIVDREGDDYWVVLRHWSPRTGWRYSVEREYVFRIGLYVRKRVTA